jgi:hypothetical protein
MTCDFQAGPSGCCVGQHPAHAGTYPQKSSRTMFHMGVSCLRSGFDTTPRASSYVNAAVSVLALSKNESTTTMKRYSHELEPEEGCIEVAFA